MNDLTTKQRTGRSSGATLDTELAALRAQLVEQIHENGRLADKLNKATTDLAAERGFLANARARADQAEIDRDEARRAAEDWQIDAARWKEGIEKAVSDKLNAELALKAAQDALRADAAPEAGDDAQTFDDRLAARLRATGGHAEEVGGMRQIGYDQLQDQIAIQSDHAMSGCWRCWLAAVLTCVICSAAVIALAVWS